MKKNVLIECPDFAVARLRNEIVKAVRRKAQSIPDFHDNKCGCIRITIVPLLANAEEWLGGERIDYVPEDRCEREFVYPIFHGGSYIKQWRAEDGHTEPVNCYGYSALKTAFKKDPHCCDAEYLTEDNGWSTHNGAVRAIITVDESHFAQLYICTSGAQSSEDLECSLAGMSAAQKFLASATGNVVTCNIY